MVESLHQVDAPFSECEAAGDDRPVRQGDVFEWIVSSPDPFESIGVVITADCDFALKKHHGRVSYVPVLRFEDYLRLFFFPPRLRRAMKPVEAELCGLIRAAQATNLPEFTEPIASETALDWVKAVGGSEIATELSLNEKKRVRLELLAESYTKTIAAVESADFVRQHDCLVDFKCTPKVSVDEARERVWQEIGTAVKDLPGDLFFVGRIPGRDEAGFVVFLRLVRDLQEGAIAVKQTDLKLAPALTKRIARLRSPYRFRLTQQLAAVFADIGLPNEYEAHRDRVVETAAQRTSKRLHAVKPEN